MDSGDVGNRDQSLPSPGRAPPPGPETECGSSAFWILCAWEPREELQGGVPCIRAQEKGHLCASR